jgi:transglutaminase-like putative cysteine protease
MRPWDAKDKALLLVSHTTWLRYAEPVVEAHSEIRKTPVDTGLQRVVTHKLEVDPAAPLGSYVDYFGTQVHYLNLLEPHRELVIRAEAVVETTDAVCCGPSEPPDGRDWRQRLAEYLHWSPSVPPLADYAEIENRVSSDLDPGDFLLALEELGATFQNRFRYDPDATDVHSSPAVLFQAGGGVCQDLAHAMLGVLRTAGVACRYVSGYVYDPINADEGDHVQGAGASHAWVQAWHPELGWVGIDPTNDKLVDWQYVRIAAGRDYTDVQPLNGVFVGPREQELDVEVSVKRIG